ncbi:Uncharacterised protein [Streptococcus pneumoniae]|nr:Uncharacterised protein [Streptococcus pneumoniae]
MSSVDPAGSLHQQPVALARRGHRGLAREEDPVHTDGGRSVEHVGEVRVLPTRADLRRHRLPVVQHAPARGVVRPQVLAGGEVAVGHRAERGGGVVAQASAPSGTLAVGVGHGDLRSI